MQFLLTQMELDTIRTERSQQLLHLRELLICCRPFVLGDLGAFNDYPDVRHERHTLILALDAAVRENPKDPS